MCSEYLGCGCGQLDRCRVRTDAEGNQLSVLFSVTRGETRSGCRACVEPTPCGEPSHRSLMHVPDEVTRVLQDSSEDRKNHCMECDTVTSAGAGRPLPPPFHLGHTAQTMEESPEAPTLPMSEHDAQDARGPNRSALRFVARPGVVTDSGRGLKGPTEAVPSVRLVLAPHKITPAQKSNGHTPLREV